mgnify:CR=1 FL=1
MKFKVEHEGDVYAVAIATGTSTNGRKYANVLLKKEAVLAIRSNYSLFLDPNDETLMNQLNLTDLTYSEDGTRKVTLLKEPIKLQEKYKLISVSLRLTRLMTESLEVHTAYVKNLTARKLLSIELYRGVLTELKASSKTQNFTMIIVNSYSSMYRRRSLRVCYNRLKNWRINSSSIFLVILIYSLT